MALGPEEIGGYVSGFFDNTVMAQMLVWLGYAVISMIIIGVFVVLWFWIQFKYKVHYPKLHFSPDGTAAQIIGWKKDRARLVKYKDGRIEHHILWLNAKIEPFREEDITPGNNVTVLKINKKEGTYIPMPTVHLEGNIADFETLTPEEKHWAVLQLKENANTYQDTDTQKRMMTYMMVTVVICLATAAFTAWIIMKQPARMADTAVALADSLQNVAIQMGGTAPG